MPTVITKYEIPLDSLGGIINLPTSDFVPEYSITSSGATILAGDWTIAPTGTQSMDMVYSFKYLATINLNGHNITIFGRNLLQNEALSVCNINATWNGSLWIVDVDMSNDGQNEGKVFSDSTDPTKNYLNGKVDKSIVVNITTHKQELSGDLTTPGNNMQYATNVRGVKGWYQKGGYDSIYPPVISLTSSLGTPPTIVAGDRYLLDDSSPMLDVNTITWQSANTVRFAFSGAPDLSGYVSGYYYQSLGTAFAATQGIFLISNVDNILKHIDVTISAISSSICDETAGSYAYGYVINGAWDGAGINYWVEYDGANWNSMSPFDGLICGTENGLIYDYFDNKWNYGNDGIYTKEVTISHAEILTCKTNPVLLVTNTDITKAVVVENVLLQTKNWTIPYSLGGGGIDFTIITDTANTVQMELEGINTATINKIVQHIPIVGSVGATTLTQIIVGKSVYFTTNGLINPINGAVGQQLKLYIRYRLQTIS